MMPCVATSKCSLVPAMRQNSKRTALDEPRTRCSVTRLQTGGGSSPGGRRTPEGTRLWHRCSPPAAVSNKDPSPNDGDDSVQDGLVNMIGLQIGQAHVSTYFEDESDRLRATAEKAKEEVDQLDKLQTNRASLAFGSALADINQSADEFEAGLRKQRVEMEADEAEFSNWQRQMAVDRSRGHFFKNLYPTEDHSRQADGFPAPPRPVVSERQLAPESPASRTQLIVCSFLAGVLLMAVTADASTSTPSWPQDVLYLCLSLGLAVTAWQQRNQGA